MSLGLLGQKLGMTRIFAEDGSSIAVTVILVENNRVAQVKTKKTDGYEAIQLAFGKKKPKRLTLPLKGHYAKASIEAGSILHEFRVSANELEQVSLGLRLDPNTIFKVGQLVDVTGISKGKGFAGVIARHNFSSNRASHGNSVSHNTPGSIGQRQDPGRVFPGKKMAGQLGNVQATIQNLEVMRIDEERSLLLIKGAIPGSEGGKVIIKPSVKAKVKVVAQ
jgi:large subunit ribosomal protein L3